MSSSTKSKSKEKRAGKEQKVSSKATGTVHGTSGISASAYNPVLGTFTALETSPISSLTSLPVNGRFRNIDETDENSGSTHGSGGDYDSASNNDSHSVESEEHKDKASGASGRQEVIPGADNEKRERIRQRNERKHQRQKEKRAQELHERCSGYLMSRKLEALAQNLVAMGFSAEQSTMALILNKGKMEEAVSWLFEGGEEADKNNNQNLDTGANLKIDITEELSRVAEMEVRFKCSKQEAERAVVACKGDLEKAEETLREQKQDPPALPSKPEDTGDPYNGTIPLATSQNTVRLQQRPSPIIIQPRKDEKELNYTKAGFTAGPTPKILNNSLQPMKIQPKLEWSRPQKMTIPAPEKRWPVGASAAPSVSYSLASPLQASSPTTMTAGSEYRNVHLGTTVAEQLVMGQRSQSVNTSFSSSPPHNWYSSGSVPFISTTKSVSPNEVISPNHQLYQQQTRYLHHHQQQQLQNHHYLQFELQGGIRAHQQEALWKRAGSSPALAVASSLGLFSGMGSTCSSGSSSPVDWHTGGSMFSFDYKNIDWSLDRTFLPSMSNKPTNGFWPSSGVSNVYDSNAMRPPSSNGNGVSIAGFQNGGSGKADKSSSAGSSEWKSPFEGSDLFSSHRQFVSSPSR